MMPIDVGIDVVKIAVLVAVVVLLVLLVLQCHINGHVKVTLTLQQALLALLCYCRYHHIIPKYTQHYNENNATVKLFTQLAQYTTVQIKILNLVSSI